MKLNGTLFKVTTTKAHEGCVAEIPAGWWKAPAESRRSFGGIWAVESDTANGQIEMVINQSNSVDVG